MHDIECKSEYQSARKNQADEQVYQLISVFYRLFPILIL